jgi:dihydroorotate dehydrogenase
VPIIGVGGIETAEDAWEKLVAGAELVQIYTGFIYEGPGLVKRLVTGIEQRVRASGCTGLADALRRARAT